MSYFSVERTSIITTVDSGRKNCFYVPEKRNFPYWDAIYVAANNSLLFIQVSCNKDIQTKFSKANESLTNEVPADVDKCKIF